LIFIFKSSKIAATLPAPMVNFIELYYYTKVNVKSTVFKGDLPMPALIFPSLLAADQRTIAHTMRTLAPHCAGFHIDVMDGIFVPHKTGEITTINHLSTITPTISWVHLMVQNPNEWIEKLELPKHSIVSFHIESLGNKIKVIKSIKEKNWHASIAINPKTDLEKMLPLLSTADHVLIMSVEPGRTGQPFLPFVEKKIDALTEYIHTNNLHCTVAIDGGVNATNIAHLAHKGVEHFVVGAALFTAPDPVTALCELQQLVG
jgi:ribulose-phosphate 3-epimerase